MFKVNFLIILCLLFTVGTSLAQEQGLSQEELAKQSQNPVASLISVPFQNNINFGIGPDDETQNVLNIQPVCPFAISDNWNLITRTIVPVISQPDFYTGGQGRINGIGNTTFTAFFSPSAPARFTWGVGPVARDTNEYRRYARGGRVVWRCGFRRPDDAGAVGCRFADKQCLGCFR